MISVLIVNDSVVVRRLVTDALSDDPAINVVGSAPNGKVALQKIAQLKPDIVTLDVEMPVMDGIQTLREMRRSGIRLPVIMFSTLTAAGASATLDALAAGASDYVTKPANAGSLVESIRNVREQLLPRIHALCERSGAGARRRFGSPPPPTTAVGTKPRPPGRTADRSAASGGAPVPESAHAGRPTGPVTLRTSRPGPIDVLAIGCSTGGPDALSNLVRSLPTSLPVPVVVVQHMPPVFTTMFAERLNRSSGLTVVEAQADMQLKAGWLYLAPGDFHLEVRRRSTAVVTGLTSAAPENFCRPAVDVLFRSVNSVFGAATLAVVLTGMGNDGRVGCEHLARSGADIVAQDAATSVVWGMPGAVATAGLATAVLPLDRIGPHLLERLSRGRNTSRQGAA